MDTNDIMLCVVLAAGIVLGAFLGGYVCAVEQMHKEAAANHAGEYYDSGNGVRFRWKPTIEAMDEAE